MGKRVRSILVITSCTFALAACSGEKHVDAALPPPPTTVPPPASPPSPPPPPPSSNYNDSEYGASTGAKAHGAIDAYNAGATGRNIKVAVIDTGVNGSLSSFAGRIDPASRDVAYEGTASDRGVTDLEGHGTSVAATIAAARDGTGMHGVAFDATILSLNTSSCGVFGACAHTGGNIAKAIDIARENDVRVINMSLGQPDVTGDILGAIRRATDAGIIVIISAGNDSDDHPNGMALQSARQAGNGLMIIAGAHNDQRELSSFSNAAGAGAAYYLTALGNVRTIDTDGQLRTASGTSYSAPIISGAAALLASAFPNLTGQQIVQILLSTADDAGVIGRDAVFGNGILNITRAFAPQGKTEMAGSAAAVSLSHNGIRSGPMGDANPKLEGAVILDGYSRAYAVDLAPTLSLAGQEQPLNSAIGKTGYRTTGGSAGPISVSLTIRQDQSNLDLHMAQASLSLKEAKRAHAVAGAAISRISKQTAVALGFSEGAQALQQRLTGHYGNAFLIARDTVSRFGFHVTGNNSSGIRHSFGPTGFTLTRESGDIGESGLIADLRRPSYQTHGFAFDRRIGTSSFVLGASRLKEESTVLGGQFSSAFFTGGSSTHFLDGKIAHDFGGGWNTTINYRRGVTTLLGNGGMVEKGNLTSEAFSFDFAKSSAIASGDKIALRVSQPLRVRSGGFDLRVPTSYNYADGIVGYEQRFFSLAPTGREVDYELAYSMNLLSGYLGANAFLRADPGHVEVMHNDIGGAIRFTLGF